MHHREHQNWCSTTTMSDGQARLPSGSRRRRQRRRDPQQAMRRQRRGDPVPIRSYVDDDSSDEAPTSASSPSPAKLTSPASDHRQCNPIISDPRSDVNSGDTKVFFLANIRPLMASRDDDDGDRRHDGQAIAARRLGSSVVTPVVSDHDDGFRAGGDERVAGGGESWLATGCRRWCRVGDGLQTLASMADESRARARRVAVSGGASWQSLAKRTRAKRGPEWAEREL
ncbi:hypothetical protein ACLOJK_038821 [Asimina triloba]